MQEGLGKKLMVLSDRYAFEDVVLGVVQAKKGLNATDKVGGACALRIRTSAFSSSGASRARCFSRSLSVEISDELVGP